MLPSGNNEPARTLSVLQITGADFAISTPSFITYLARLAQDELGLDPRSIGLKNIGLGGEPGAGLPDVRRQIQETWGAKVYDCMGTADFCTVIWSECECQDGMHFFGQGYIIPELLDPLTGEVIEAKKGVVGELLYTAIHRECTPLIRFKIGDLVEVVGDGTCDCGRTGIRISCVGRADDMLIVQGVNVYPSAVADVVSSFRPRTTGEIRIFADGAGPNVQPPVRIQVEYERCGRIGSIKTRHRARDPPEASVPSPYRMGGKRCIGCAGRDETEACRAPKSFFAITASQVIKKVATPNDLVGSAFFLTSNDAAFITGQNYAVDGGVAKYAKRIPCVLQGKFHIGGGKAW